MNVPFLPASLVEQVGWLLIHSAWQFTLIALVVMALLRLLRRGSAAVRYGICLTALLAITIAPAITWTLLPATAPQSPDVAGHAVSPQDATLVADVIETDTIAADDVEVGDVETSAMLATGETFAAAGDVSAAGSVGSPMRDVAATPPVAPWWTRLGAGVSPWLNELVALWCVGVLLFALRPLGSWYLVHRLRRVGVSPVSQPVRAAFDRAAERIGVRRPVRVLASSLARVPMVVGYVRPVILLPLCVVSGLSSEEVEAILAHELAHIRRHDYLVNLLQTLIETVCFYHPAVWWLSSRIRQEREHCCDDVAAHALGNRSTYGRALLALEELRARTPVLSLTATGGSLLERIRRLAGVEQSPPAAALGLIGPLFLFALLAGGGLWSASQAQESAPVAADEIAAQVEADADADGPGSSAEADESRAEEQDETSESMPQGVVSGVLIRAADGSPVSGARVTLRGGKAQYTESDEQGRFRFEEIQPSTWQYRIWARAGNLVTPIVQVQQMIADDGESARFGRQRLEMKPGHQVRFTITSAETGEPLAGADVKIGYPHRQTVTSDADGVALVEGLLPQEYDVTIEAVGYARAGPQLNLSQAAALTEYTTRLDAGGVVRGVVVDEQGQPISEATVVYRVPQTSVGFYGDDVRIADDGWFQNRFLPLNTPIEVSVRAEDYLRQEQNVTLVPTKREAEVKVTLKRRALGGSVAGIVKDAQGQPVPDVEVANYGRMSSPHVKTTTDADGRFVLHDLMESFTGHLINLSADGFAPQRLEVKTGTAADPGEVAVTLQPGHSLRGQIVDENSQPLKGANISPRSPAFGFGFGTLVTTGDDGRFSFDDLPPDVMFDVNHEFYPGLRGMEFELDGDEPVTIAFEPPGVIRGRVVVAATGKPVPQFRVQLGFSNDRRPGDAKGTYNSQWAEPGLTFNAADGRFVIQPLTSGFAAELEVLAEGYDKSLVARAVAAPLDESEELTISLQPAEMVEPFTLSGQLLDHAGQPAVGAQLRLIVTKEPPASAEDNKYNWVLIDSRQLGRKSYVEQFLSGVTDADGRFEFKDVAANAFLQLAYWGKGVPRGRSLAFDQTKAGQSESVTIELPEPATIRGTIERANFPDAGEIKLMRQRAAWHNYEIKLTDDQTTFEFNDLPPGEYGVYVATKPVEHIEDGNTFYRQSMVASQKVELKAGDTHEVTFTKPDKE